MLRKYNEADLNIELERAIAATMSRRETVHPAWITHTICKTHRDGLAVDADKSETIEPEDVAFWRFCGYTHTRKLATAFINALEPNGEDESDEPFLPGFVFLRPQYVTRRDGVDVMVPTEDMTPEELRAKAKQYRRNAVSLTGHADELDRYAGMRASQAVGQ